MEKIDINISKKMTINTGNYSSIGPSVSFTLKDVDPEKAENLLEKMKDLVEVEFVLQVLHSASTMEEIKINGLKDFVKKQLENSKELEDILKNSWGEIIRETKTSEKF